MVEVVRGDRLGEEFRRRVTGVLVDGFAEDFAFFGADREARVALFAPMVVLERFHVALVDGEPAAVAFYAQGDQGCFAPSWREVRRVRGLVRGTFTYLVIRSQFLGGTVPDGVAEIGFVTTAPRFQGRGVATALLRHLLALPGPSAHVLEDIKDTNESALGLYRKLGFREYRRRPVRFAKRAGFRYYVSMRRSEGDAVDAVGT